MTSVADIARVYWQGRAPWSAASRSGAGGAEAAAEQRPAAQHPVHHGRRHRLVQPSIYHRGMMVRRNAEHRSHRQRRRDVHRLLRRAELHGGPRNAFITGELPIRTGMTTVGNGPAARRTAGRGTRRSPRSLKTMGYATGQFGKNHLGDQNEFLPTAHGFDEFFGYLYHLDAMDDPEHPDYPKSSRQGRSPQYGSLLGHDVDDADRAAALGQGRQAKDRGHRPRRIRKRMETVDDEILKVGTRFHGQAQHRQQAVLRWLNPTRMHIFTHLSPKYRGAAQGRE